MIIILIWIILFSILGSVGAIIFAGTFLFLSEKIQKILIPVLVSFATGILLAAALLGLIPEAIEHIEDLGGETYVVWPFILGGILIFFFLEKIIIWRNCRNKECEVHSHASGPIILIGDGLHNLTDGIVIATAFLTNFTLGIGAGLTILVHELAQETGDFGILLHSGYSRKKAFVYNLISSSITIPAAILGYFILGFFESIIPFILALSAASFIYIALSDLTPDLHKHTDIKYSIRQFLFIILGIVLMFLVLTLGGHNH